MLKVYQSKKWLIANLSTVGRQHVTIKNNKNKHMKKLFVLPILLLLLASCSSENEDDIPVDKVTYTETIKAIIDNSCLNCHVNPPVNGASMSLITFQNVRDAVLNRGLIDKVESGAMPPIGDFLTTAQVQTIKDWQSGGFQQ